jgi:hypothetical protein
MTKDVLDIDYVKRRITLTIERYVELLKSEECLSRLESGGVDNWDWYSDSLYPKNKQPYDEFCDELDEKFKGK